MPADALNTSADAKAVGAGRDEANSSRSVLAMERAVAAGDASRDALVREVADLDEDHGGSGAPTFPVRQLLLRSLPDVASLLAPHLAQLSPDGAAHVLDPLFESPPFDDRRMRRWTPRLRDHLGEYAEALGRWGTWEPVTFEIEPLAENVAVRWVTAWERPDDGAVAADFVGYVKDPKDFARPNLAFAAFLRDAVAAYRRLADEYGEDRVKGLRLWIVGRDGEPVVRWLL